MHVIDRANASFWNPPSLDALMAAVEPLCADEHFEIEDITEEEWQEFVDALDD